MKIITLYAENKEVNYFSCIVSDKMYNRLNFLTNYAGFRRFSIDYEDDTEEEETKFSLIYDKFLCFVFPFASEEEVLKSTNHVSTDLIQDEEFTIKIVSFLKTSASEQLQTIIKEAHFYTEISYKDANGEEDLIGLSALEELTLLEWIKDTTREELKHIRLLMDTQDACYFRLI